MDSREPATLRASIKKKFKEKAIFEEKTLTEGDYLISDSVVVERKRIDDLYSSIMDGRLKSQVCRLTTTYAGKLIVIFVHGSLDEYAKECRIKRKVFINTKVVFSALAEVMCSGIMVVWVEDKKNGTDQLINFMLDVGEGKWLVPQSCDPDIIMAKLLKINRTQMQALLAQCGSLAKIAAASPTSFTKIKGIGDKKAAYIKSVLNGR